MNGEKNVGEWAFGLSPLNQIQIPSYATNDRLKFELPEDCRHWSELAASHINIHRIIAFGIVGPGPT